MEEMKTLIAEEKVNPTSNTTEVRNASFELLRIVSMIMIIIIHFLDLGGFLENPTGVNHILVQVVRILCIVCVNLFVMISAWFMVGKKIKYQKLVELWIEVFFYIAVIYLVLLSCGKIQPTWTDLKNFAPIITQRYWFVTAYFIFYLSIPLLNIIVEHLSKNQHLLLCVGLLILCFSDIISGWSTWTYNDGFSGLWFMAVFLFMAFVKKYQTKALPWWAYLLIYFAASALSYFTGYFYSHPLTLVASFCIFEIFRKIKIKNKLLSKFILTISSTTFGIYLIHENIYLRPIMYDEIFHTTSFHSSPYAIPIMLGFALAVFVACTIVELLRQQLFKLFKLVAATIKRKTSKHNKPDKQ